MGGGDGGAGAIKAQNLKNQQQVSQGMDSLNSIFFGGSYGQNPASGYTLGGTYYDSQGKAIDKSSQDFTQWLKQNPVIVLPQPAKDGKGGGYANPTGRNTYVPAVKTTPDNSFDRYMADQAKAGNLFSNKQTTTGFDKAFYDKQQQDYLNYANPQLQQQFGQTKQQLQYKLGNQGLFGGSAQRELQTGLANEKSLAQINMSNQALGQSNQARQNVNNQYNTLVGQLEASMNPGVTTQQALQSASTFSAPSAMPAVGQLFNNYANTYLAGLNQNTYGNMGGSGMNYNNQFSAPVANTVTNRNG
jgi:hypothetical protein